MPPFVTDMQGKTYTFHVKLATYDFTAGRQSFTVTRIINMNERLPLPEFVDHVSLTYLIDVALFWLYFGCLYNLYVSGRR